MRVIALSSSYGSGGSLIAPGVAQRLEVPFLRRVKLEPNDEETVDDVITEGPLEAEDLTRSLWERILDAFAAMPVEHGMVPTTVPADAALQVKSKVEARLKAFAATPEGGVVYGWAAAAVLPAAYRVLLHGPDDARLAQAMRIEDIDEETARQRMEKSNAVRRVYWKRLYNRDWLDRSLFHICLDSTAIDIDASIDVIATAATSYWDRTG